MIIKTLNNISFRFSTATTTAALIRYIISLCWCIQQIKPGNQRRVKKRLRTTSWKQPEGTTFRSDTYIQYIYKILCIAVHNTFLICSFIYLGRCFWVGPNNVDIICICACVYGWLVDNCWLTTPARAAKNVAYH